MGVQTRKAERAYGLGPAGQLVEAAPPQRTALDAREHESDLFRLDEDLQVPPSAG